MIIPAAAVYPVSSFVFSSGHHNESSSVVDAVYVDRLLQCDLFGRNNSHTFYSLFSSFLCFLDSEGYSEMYIGRLESPAALVKIIQYFRYKKLCDV